MIDNTPSAAVPPGEIIREELEERGWSQQDLARILGRPLPAVSEIIMGKRSITTQTARELAEAFGTSADLWLNLETAYQLNTSGEPPRDIRRRALLFGNAPVKDMERRGWIKATKNDSDLEAELCRFFAIDSIDTPPPLKIAARQSVNTDALTAAQVAWCHRAAQLARCIQAAPYEKDRLVAQLPRLREYIRLADSVRRVPRFLAESCGVRLVIVEHLSRTRIDGAALMINDAPVIALSLRFDRIDSFWHTLTHELIHVLNEDGEAMIDVDLYDDSDHAWSARPEVEKRTDEAAAALLVPPGEIESFIFRVKPLYSKAKIIQFANRLKVHPGIVVGQLQHRGELGYSANREMLVKVRDLLIGDAITDGFGHTPMGV